MDLVISNKKYQAEFGDILAKLPPKEKGVGPDKRRREYKLYIKLVKERMNEDEKRI